MNHAHGDLDHALMDTIGLMLWERTASLSSGPAMSEVESYALLPPHAHLSTTFRRVLTTTGSHIPLYRIRLPWQSLRVFMTTMSICSERLKSSVFPCESGLTPTSEGV